MAEGLEMEAGSKEEPTLEVEATAAVSPAAVVDALVADVLVATDSVACWAVMVAGLEAAEGWTTLRWAVEAVGVVTAGMEEVAMVVADLVLLAQASGGEMVLLYYMHLSMPPCRCMLHGRWPHRSHSSHSRA